ncbi:energy conserving hydrogenase EhbF [Methanococcus maripaludis]|uniref:Energy conserving hydrogenase EhbF n=1 Tax=Methanococcus maripaludis TaxID=39152 RepID=A0A8T3VX86_METMI|nr:energy conserving hydrogenase EhbF [Methanococcus maripaludis]MBG0769226.1 energy conserving hydrogenase EhbF [Methanococcus maripaludis]
MNLLPLIVVFPMFVAIIFNYLNGKDKLIRPMTLIMAILLLALPFIGSYGIYNFGAHGIENGLISGISYLYTPVKQLIITVIMLIGSLVLITGLGEKKSSGLFVALMLMGLASVSAVVMADDLFNIYVFYEIAAIAQTGLVIASGTEKAYRSAFRYLILGNFAGSILLLGVSMLLAATGTLNITDMHNFLLNNPSTPTIYGGLLMLIIGLCYGSGLPPFHTVKADIYARAKPHVAAMLQTYSKFVLVALLLVIFKLFGGLSYFASAHGVLIGLSVLGMVFGVVMALLQTDYKKLLAYHAISQGGYVAAGIALGTPLGIVAGIFHAINHVIYKSALFLGAHIVERRKEGNLNKLGGLLPVIPATAFMVLCAKLAISGVPPFNGFQSKLLLAEAAMNVNMPELAIIMILVSIGTFVSMMKAFYLIYLKPCSQEQLEEYKKAKPSKYAVFSLAVLTFLCILLGIFQNLATDIIYPFANEIGRVWTL